MTTITCRNFQHADNVDLIVEFVGSSPIKAPVVSLSKNHLYPYCLVLYWLVAGTVVLIIKVLLATVPVTNQY